MCKIPNHLHSEGSDKHMDDTFVNNQLVSFVPLRSEYHKGCNAAVFKARRKTLDTIAQSDHEIERVKQLFLFCVLLCP